MSKAARKNCFTAPSAAKPARVKKLIAGPSVFICDECIELCNDIIRDELPDRSSKGGGSDLPTRGNQHHPRTST